MTIQITPLHPLFAAEITGADLTGEIPHDLVQLVDQAMADYGVVVLRDQHISDEQHIAFSAKLGVLEKLPDMGMKDRAYRLPRELFDASNLDADNEIMAPDDLRWDFSKGNLLWHTDSSYNELPTRYSLLLARTIPPVGGNTDFADMHDAYHDLPEETKQKIDGLYTIHYLWHSRVKGGLDESRITVRMKEAMPPARHKLVRTVAESGRKGLMIGGHCSHIEGWPIEEGRAFLEELLQQVTREQYVYSHAWRTADMVIWDNRCVLHRATPYDDKTYKRDMRRTTVDEFPN